MKVIIDISNPFLQAGYTMLVMGADSESEEAQMAEAALELKNRQEPISLDMTEDSPIFGGNTKLLREFATSIAGLSILQAIADNNKTNRN